MEKTNDKEAGDERGHPNNGPPPPLAFNDLRCGHEVFIKPWHHLLLFI
jgi:hypothetical protein